MEPKWSPKFRKKQSENRSENRGARMFKAEVRGGPWFEGRRQWRDPGKRSLTEFTEVSGEKEGAGVYGGGLPYAQYPEGTADLMAYATAADILWRIGGVEDWWIGGLEDSRIGGLVDWRIGGSEDVCGLVDWWICGLKDFHRFLFYFHTLY